MDKNIIMTSGETNLLDETLDVMKHNGKKPIHINYIGSNNYECTWEQFNTIADKKYDCNTAKFQVAYDLVIVFKDDSWMERVHDGKWEHWQYHKTPTSNKKTKTIKNLFGKDQNLEQIN